MPTIVFQIELKKCFRKLHGWCVDNWIDQSCVDPIAPMYVIPFFTTWQLIAGILEGNDILEV